MPRNNFEEGLSGVKSYKHKETAYVIKISRLIFEKVTHFNFLYNFLDKIGPSEIFFDEYIIVHFKIFGIIIK